MDDHTVITQDCSMARTRLRRHLGAVNMWKVASICDRSLRGAFGSVKEMVDDTRS